MRDRPIRISLSISSKDPLFAQLVRLAADERRKPPELVRLLVRTGLRHHARRSGRVPCEVNGNLFEFPSLTEPPEEEAGG